MGGTRTKGVKGRRATRRVLHQRLIYNTFIYDEGKEPSNLFGGSKGEGTKGAFGLGFGEFFLEIAFLLDFFHIVILKHEKILKKAILMREYYSLFFL